MRPATVDEARVHRHHDNSQRLSLLLSRLEAVRRSGDGWAARCPTHDDRHPSLSVALGRDEQILVFCQAGCETEVVVAAVDMTMTDLFPPEPARTVVVETMYCVLDVGGSLQARHLRWDGRPDGKRLAWRNASGEKGLGGRPSASLPLYGSERVKAWSDTEPVYVTEGEKAADAVLAAGRWCRRLGHWCLSLPGC